AARPAAGAAAAVEVGPLAPAGQSVRRGPAAPLLASPPPRGRGAPARQRGGGGGGGPGGGAWGGTRARLSPAPPPGGEGAGGAGRTAACGATSKRRQAFPPAAPVGAHRSLTGPFNSCTVPRRRRRPRPGRPPDRPSFVSGYTFRAAGRASAQGRLHQRLDPPG